MTIIKNFHRQTKRKTDRQTGYLVYEIIKENFDEVLFKGPICPEYAFKLLRDKRKAELRINLYLLNSQPLYPNPTGFI